MTQKKSDPTPALVFAGVKIRDFKRLEFFQADLGGQHLQLSGPNSSGKTSVLDALLSLLGLVKSKEIPEPVRKGAAKAVVEADLVDQLTGEVQFRLRQEWSGQQRVYTVHGRDGKPIPLRDFQQLVDSHLANPVEFLRLRPQDLLDELLRAFGVEAPVDQVQQITGEAHQPKEGESASAYLERLSADDTGLYYDRRRDAHRILTQKKAAMEELQRKIGPADRDGLRAAGPTIAELLKRRKALEADQARRAEAEYAAAAAKADAATKARLLANRQAELARAEKDADDLRRQLAAKEAEINDLKSRIAKGEKIIAEAEDLARTKQETFAAAPDMEPGLQEIDKALCEAQANAKAVQEQELRAAEFRRLEQETATADQQYQRLAFVLEELRALRRNLLQGLNLGIDGLEVGEGQLWLRGVPFQQASLAESIDCACAIAFRKRPGARVAIIDNGEHLDAEHRQRVIQRATEHGCQLCLAVVRDTEGLAWEVVE